MLRFDCPHCGEALQCAESWYGETHPCPECCKWVLIRNIDPQEAMRMGMKAGALAALKALIYGRGD
jgi:hypothetical protein